MTSREHPAAQGITRKTTDCAGISANFEANQSYISGMKYCIILILISIAAVALAKQKRHENGQEPWNASQLEMPSDLAAILNDPKAQKPIVICVGPGALVKGSVDMGPAKEKENLEKLKHMLERIPKNANIVIYCGCCPFEHCPNIRPAFNLLNDMKFTNAHLLNLEHNIKTDWVAKGFPSVKNE